jgi:hypothetical protein
VSLCSQLGFSPELLRVLFVKPLFQPADLCSVLPILAIQ